MSNQLGVIQFSLSVTQLNRYLVEVRQRKEEEEERFSIGAVASLVSLPHVVLTSMVYISVDCNLGYRISLSFSNRLNIYWDT